MAFRVRRTKANVSSIHTVPYFPILTSNLVLISLCAILAHQETNKAKIDVLEKCLAHSDEPGVTEWCQSERRNVLETLVKPTVDEVPCLLQLLEEDGNVDLLLNRSAQQTFHRDGQQADLFSQDHPSTLRIQVNRRFLACLYCPIHRVFHAHGG